MVEVDHPELSVRRQCELLGLNRSTFYYEPTGAAPEDLRLMRLIDEGPVVPRHPPSTLEQITK